MPGAAVHVVVSGADVGLVLSVDQNTGSPAQENDGPARDAVGNGDTTRDAAAVSLQLPNVTACTTVTVPGTAVRAAGKEAPETGRSAPLAVHVSTAPEVAAGAFTAVPAHTAAGKVKAASGMD